MPVTVIDPVSPALVSPRPVAAAMPEERPMPQPTRGRRPPSRRRRRVTGRLSRLAAMLAMGAWIAVGLMPVAAVLLAVYG